MNLNESGECEGIGLHIPSLPPRAPVPGSGPHTPRASSLTGTHSWTCIEEQGQAGFSGRWGSEVARVKCSFKGVFAKAASGLSVLRFGEGGRGEGAGSGGLGPDEEVSE